VKFGIIMDVEASRAIRQAEVGASQTMIERTEASFGIKPARSGHRLWLSLQPRLAGERAGNRAACPGHRQVEAGWWHVLAEDFIYDEARDIYTCPAGKTMTTTGHISTDHAARYLVSVPECRACPLKAKCCPNMPARRIVRDVNEAARDIARTLPETEAFAQSRRDRKKVRDAVCTPEAHSAARPIAPSRPSGAQFEFTLAAIGAEFA
jgi:hypothetical protein